jgi:branched-chain amino acid aminotransferase
MGEHEATGGSRPEPNGRPSVKRVAYLDGEFVAHEDARVSIASHVVNYGTGCFEGIRAYWNSSHEQLYVTLLDAHAERLVRSARILTLDTRLEAGEIAGVVVELLRRNGLRQDAYVRPLVFKSEETITVKLAGLRTSFAAYCQPMGEYLAIDRGLSLAYSAWRRIDDNAMPARAKVIGSYVNAALASDDARENGFDEALMLNGEGHVAEASSSNIFFVMDGALHTPAASEDILVGVTRGAVIELAGELGLPVNERRIDRSESYLAEEAFLCGTGVQLAPVTSIDRRPVGDGKPGPVTRQLQDAYLAAVRGEERDGAAGGQPAWRTPVYV